MRRLEPKTCSEDNLLPESDLDDCNISEKENDDHILNVPLACPMYKLISVLKESNGQLLYFRKQTIGGCS